MNVVQTLNKTNKTLAEVEKDVKDIYQQGKADGRKEIIEELETGKCRDFSCKNCDYKNRELGEYPCCKCMRIARDYFKPKGV